MEDQIQPSAIPTGMLRISKDGQPHQLIYPVHADGWRQLGWTVHPPQLEAIENEDGEHDEDDEGAALPLPQGSQPVLPGEAGDEVPDFVGMTKAQIIATVEELHGVGLDSAMTKAQLVAAAEQLAAGGTGEGQTIEPLVPGLLDEGDGLAADIPDALLV